MNSIMSCIKNLIKLARILSVNDSVDIRTAQIEFLGKRQSAAVFSPYGLMHNPPANSMGPVWQINGEESKLMGIFDRSDQRTLKNLESGEVAIGNYATGDYVHFRNGRIVKIVATGNVDVEAAGSAVVNAGASAEVTAPAITLNGPVTINGTLNVTDAATLGSTLSTTGAITTPGITIGGIPFGTHRHSGVTSGASNTGGPL